MHSVPPHPHRLDIQTSVAVISPSKAKSVCSLSVCFVKATESIPSGKKKKEEYKQNSTPDIVKKRFETTRAVFSLYNDRWKQNGNAQFALQSQTNAPEKVGKTAAKENSKKSK